MAHCSSITTTTFVFATTLTVLSVYYSPSSILVGAQTPQVPCLFFFGDSQTDNGNNNVLATFAKVNYNPYGIDYPTGPTGRFANGRNSPDYLAELLGFGSPIPPYVSTPLTDPNIAQGVNYASGGAGILNSSGQQLGQRFPMDTQLFFHGLVKTRIATVNGSEYLKKCLYVVNMGSNDYLNNYLLPASTTRALFPDPDQFAQYLIQQFSTQLRTLYNYGARKVAVYGIGLLGCVPAQIAANNASGCVDSVNNQVQLFNNRLKPLIDTLNSQLSNARYTYINATNIALGDPSLAGVTVAAVPCCQVSNITGLCIPNSVPCPNRDVYSFWDNFHVTSILNRATATRSYNATQPADASPYDISHLVQL